MTEIIVNQPFLVDVPYSLKPGNGDNGDWQDWIQNNYLKIGLAGVGTCGLILFWPKGKGK